MITKCLFISVEFKGFLYFTSMRQKIEIVEHNCLLASHKQYRQCSLETFLLPARRRSIRKRDNNLATCQQKQTVCICREIICGEIELNCHENNEESVENTEMHEYLNDGTCRHCETRHPSYTLTALFRYITETHFYIRQPKQFILAPVCWLFVCYRFYFSACKRMIHLNTLHVYACCV